MNPLPIVERELRVAARKPVTYWMRFWFALVAITIWMLVIHFARNIVSAELGQHLLNALGILALTFALLSGILLTADSIAEERREGTLGLLFLTNLKSYDVVFGKLAANSLNSVFGLLAIFPVMGLAMLLGGVTPAEFTRLMLVFMLTLFFSMSLGIFVSASARDSKQAIFKSFGWLIFFTGVCPMLWWLTGSFFGSANRFATKHRLLDFLLYPSPAYAYKAAFGSDYNAGTGAVDFWRSLGTIAALGSLAIIIATVQLPKVWKESAEMGTAGGRTGMFGRIFKKHQPIPFLGSKWTLDPLFWLCARENSWPIVSSKTILLFVPALAALLHAFVKMNDEAFVMLVIVAYATHFIVKLLMAVEASRRMYEDRRSGAWELLLVTPVTPESVLSGQSKALRSQFAGAIWLLVVLNLLLTCFIIMVGKSMQMNREDCFFFCNIFLGGIAALLLDFHAINWVGMWRGLNAKKHHHAIIYTLLKIMAACPLYFFILMFLGPSPGARWKVALYINAFFIIGAINSGVGAALARNKLKKSFKCIVSQPSQS